MSLLNILLIIFALSFLCIIIFFDEFSYFFKKSKSKLSKIYGAIKEIPKFRHLFLLTFYVVGIIIFEFFIFYNVHMIYFFYYWIFILLNFLLIVNISNINIKENLTKFEAFRFIVTYFIICLLEVILFSVAYYTTSAFNKGQISLNNQFYNLDLSGSFHVSIVVFLANYLQFMPEGIYMKLLIVLQVLSSQLILLGFLFIMFGQILEKVKKGEVLNRKGKVK
ncbi:hypothetical protein HYS31_00045 [Candidatus Woesearchaeota archaeon]|nr:hypothetical protein [Candidatus Woesearchaeota archaeon]